MLESVSERLMQTVHAGSPTKHPARRLRDDRSRGRAEDPVHERDPRGDRGDRARSASNRWRRSRELHARHGHIQEVILQNFVPHQRYYGREPARDRRRGGRGTTGARASRDGRPALDAARVGAAPVSIEDMRG